MAEDRSGVVQLILPDRFWAEQPDLVPHPFREIDIQNYSVEIPRRYKHDNTSVISPSDIPLITKILGIGQSGNVEGNFRWLSDIHPQLVAEQLLFDERSERERIPPNDAGRNINCAPDFVLYSPEQDIIDSENLIVRKFVGMILEKYNQFAMMTFRHLNRDLDFDFRDPERTLEQLRRVFPVPDTELRNERLLPQGRFTREDTTLAMTETEEELYGMFLIMAETLYQRRPGEPEDALPQKLPDGFHISFIRDMLRVWRDSHTIEDAEEETAITPEEIRILWQSPDVDNWISQAETTWEAVLYGSDGPPIQFYPPEYLTQEIQDTDELAAALFDSPNLGITKIHELGRGGRIIEQPQIAFHIPIGQELLKMYQGRISLTNRQLEMLSQKRLMIKIRPDILVMNPDGTITVIDDKLSLQGYHDEQNGDYEGLNSARRLQMYLTHLGAVAFAHAYPLDQPIPQFIAGPIPVTRDPIYDGGTILEKAGQTRVNIFHRNSRILSGQRQLGTSNFDYRDYTLPLDQTAQFPDPLEMQFLLRDLCVIGDLRISHKKQVKAMMNRAREGQNHPKPVYSLDRTCSILRARHVASV